MEMEMLTREKGFDGDAEMQERKKKLSRPRDLLWESVAEAGCGARTNESLGDDPARFRPLPFAPHKSPNEVLPRNLDRPPASWFSSLPDLRRISSKSCLFGLVPLLDRAERILPR